MRTRRFRCLRRLRTLRTEERGGFAPVELALTVGLWLLPLTLLVASLPTWVERQSLGRVAAAEAARAVALAPDLQTGWLRAEELRVSLARSHDVEGGDLDVTVDGELVRGGEIVVTSAVAVPALSVPLLGVEAPAVTLRHTQVERVDDYRSFGPDP